MSQQDNKLPSDAAGTRRDIDAGGELTVLVFAPRGGSERKYTWSKNLLVGEAADQAARDFGYEAGTPTFQNRDKEVLQRDQTLLAAGVRDFDQLELTDTGGGV